MVFSDKKNDKKPKIDKKNHNKPQQTLYFIKSQLITQKTYKNNKKHIDINIITQQKFLKMAIEPRTHIKMC